MEEYKLVIECVFLGMLALTLNYIGDYKTLVKYVTFGMVSSVCFIGIYWLISLFIGGFSLIYPVVIWLTLFLMVPIIIDDKSIF